MSASRRHASPSPSRLRILIAVSLVAATSISIAIALSVLWLKGPTGRADADDPAQVSVGRSVYAAQCARCHGNELQGQPNWRERLPNGRLPAPPHDESGHTWHHPDRILFDITRRGLNPPNAPEGYESDMPAYHGVLSDAEIWAVVAFLKHSWPPLIQSRQRRITEQAGR